ncbi:Hsp20/alpha crystallin family protein [Bacillus benzoevorans]|uniref:HSP20 family protein n=1 Tax=Bacillus benzoevorans TaxID=1456 RepID=A0A7X0HUK3_9BACI|nr:Hsp20/alpha crystallin family protein [Bacillus benzoevorans]MBB6447076.1 HSP20 family protein [Bacillus benzoevorans]
MDMNKILQWMDLAKKSQTTDFWKDIFDQPSFNEFMTNTQDQGQPASHSFNPGVGNHFPPTDIYITDEDVLLISDLAGYAKEDIHLSISGTNLLIKGNNSRAITGKLVHQERHQGPFQRIIQLPEPAYPNQMKAKFNEGLLCISYKRQFRDEEQVPID